MLNIRITLPNGITIHFPETDFLCPECDSFHKFYSVSPVRCNTCRTSIPDIRQLKKLEEARVVYHFGDKL